MRKNPHVGIVGAGIAGLKCADVLLKHGFRVTILEARDRIGGRVCQNNVGGYIVDVGPNWIHGTQDNPILDLSTSSKTITHAFGGLQRVIDTYGQPLEDKMVEKLSDFLWNTVEDAYEYSRLNKDSIPASKSLFDYLKEKLEQSELTDRERETCIELSKLWGCYIGSPVDRQSLRFFFLEECLEGTNLFVASTYKDILNSIAKPALDGAEIHLNEPVTKIEAEPRRPGTSHQVKVKTLPGMEYTFDELVSTLPLGFLKQNKSIFNPALPQRLSHAIDSISYGRLEKVYIHFPAAFWEPPSTDTSANLPNPPPNPTTTTQDPEGKEKEEPHQQTTEPPEISPFTEFLTPTTYDPTRPPTTPFWNQECVSLARLPAPCAHPTLLFYTYGPSSTHLVSQISPFPPTSPEYHTAISTFFHPYYSRLPGYDPSSPTCQPTAVLATQWQNDKWSGNGSYSNFQVGLEEGDRDIEVLREGVGVERGVWFAGEHTAPFVGLGTTSGAYWSGEAVGERVWEFLGGGGEGGVRNGNGNGKGFGE
ncbi:hypothetical protein FQN50_004404 [Emmonsiellopsis sp. PD_5]|nr:hypothetical protein FQN50_004404 [Emmonsiellopsis sp. PD_5]